MFFVTAKNQSPAGTTEVIRMVSWQPIVFRDGKVAKIIAGHVPAISPILFSDRRRGLGSQNVTKM
jgi:hypothetical protein